MKSAAPRRRTGRGITLIELTVVLAVLMSIVTTLMIGARAWKRGMDRTTCVANIRNIQTAVRSYQNLYGYRPGNTPMSEAGSRSIIDHLLAKGYIASQLHHSVKVEHSCPGGGEYRMPFEELFPPDGELYLGCSLGDEMEHKLTRPGPGSW